MSAPKKQTNLTKTEAYLGFIYTPLKAVNLRGIRGHTSWEQFEILIIRNEFQSFGGKSKDFNQ